MGLRWKGRELRGMNRKKKNNFSPAKHAARELRKYYADSLAPHLRPNGLDKLNILQQGELRHELCYSQQQRMDERLKIMMNHGSITHQAPVDTHVMQGLDR